MFFRRKKKPTHLYALVPLTADNGRGLIVERLADKQRLQWNTLPRTDGLEAFNVAGTIHYLDALQRPEFAPGQPVALVPEPDNPYDKNAIAVYDSRRRHMVGYVPKSDAARLGKKLAQGGAAISMWEFIKNGRRDGLRVLLIKEGASIRR